MQCFGDPIKSKSKSSGSSEFMWAQEQVQIVSLEVVFGHCLTDTQEYVGHFIFAPNMLGERTSHPVFDTLQTLVKYAPVQEARKLAPGSTEYLDLLWEIPGCEALEPKCS